MSKTLTFLAIGITLIAFYIGLTEVVLKDTTKMMDSQSELLRQRTSGEISAAEYSAASSRTEKEYRTSISDRIKLLVQKIKWIANLADKIGVGSAYREKVGLEPKDANMSVGIRSLAEDLEKRSEEFSQG